MQIAGGQRQRAGAGAGAAPRPTLAPVFSPGPETGPTHCPRRTDGRMDRRAAAGPWCLPSPTGCSWRGASPGDRQRRLLHPATLIPLHPLCDPSWDWHGLISPPAVPNYLLLRPKVPSLNPNQGHSSPRTQQLIPPAGGREQQCGEAGCRVTSVPTPPGAACGDTQSSSPVPRLGGVTQSPGCTHGSPQLRPKRHRPSELNKP